MDEMNNEDRLADLLDEYLRHLRGEGPRPDLTALDDAQRAEVEAVLELAEAMADTLPASPPLDADPVAIRLGLVSATSAVEATDDPGDAVFADAEEVSYRFGGAVEVERVPIVGDAPTIGSPAVLCRSMVEIVLVVLADAARPPTAADARSIFHERPELSAVAFSTPDATLAAVVTYSQCVDRLVPGHGWSGPPELVWEPLEIALARHFERSIPRWDAVATLPPADTLEDLAAEARAVVVTEVARVANSRVQLPHKRRARDFVASLDPDDFVTWIDAVRTRRASGSDLVTTVLDVCRTTSP